MTTEEYLNLITSEFRQKPNFIAMITADVAPMVQVQALMESMVPIFDVDTAVGSQLDILGKWAGISRNIAIPITGIYFTWNSTPAVGWNFGVWQPSSVPADITSLPDDAYRVLLKAKIAANRWDGTIDGAYVIWDALFPTITILIQDNQDMTYDLAVIGTVDTLTLALITGGYIPLKPEGVRVNEYLIPIDPTAPVFAWDVEGPILQGWDEGEWIQQIAPT